MKLDTTKSGLDSLFKPYQGLLLEHIWSLNEKAIEKVAVGSGRAHAYLLGTPEAKSRAAVIFFLNDMVDEGVLGFDDKTGKGGHHRLYWPKMNRAQFAEHTVKEIVGGVAKAFPEDQMVQKFAGLVLPMGKFVKDRE